MAKVLGKILLAAIFAPGVIQSMTSLYPPYGVAHARGAYKKRPLMIPDAATMVRMAQMRELKDDDFSRLMGESGYDVNLAHAMLRSARTYMSALDYIAGARRGLLSDDDAKTALAEMGFTAEDIVRLWGVTEYIPTPEDLIRFAVRDIYDEGARQRQNLDAEFPDSFAGAALKIGMQSDTAKNYWAAHWNLPAPGQVFEMFHRKEIDEDKLKDYLRAADYAPEWRDRLKNINYRLLDRVDLRRMYAAGLIDETRLQGAYEADGYSPADAQLLVQFTIHLAKHTDEPTPKGNTVGQYKNGTIDRATALTRLKAGGYSVTDATLALDDADAQNKQELIALEADAIMDAYVRGVITLNDVYAQLTVLGVPPAQLQLTVQRELAQARKRQKSASKSDLDSWYKQGLISEKEYSDRLSLLGYSASDAAKYTAEVKLAVVQGADAKMPWAFILRDFVEGRTSSDGAISQLQELGYNGNLLDEFTDIISLIKR